MEISTCIRGICTSFKFSNDTWYISCELTSFFYRSEEFVFPSILNINEQNIAKHFEQDVQWDIPDKIRPDVITLTKIYNNLENFNLGEEFGKVFDKIKKKTVPCITIKLYRRSLLDLELYDTLNNLEEAQALTDKKIAHDEFRIDCNEKKLIELSNRYDSLDKYMASMHFLAISDGDFKFSSDIDESKLLNHLKNNRVLSEKELHKTYVNIQNTTTLTEYFKYVKYEGIASMIACLHDCGYMIADNTFGTEDIAVLKYKFPPEGYTLDTVVSLSPGDKIPELVNLLNIVEVKIGTHYGIYAYKFKLQ